MLTPRLAWAEPAAAPAPSSTNTPAPAAEAPAEPTEMPTRWYGWQILIADGAAVGQLVLGVSLDFIPLILTGGFTYGLGGPVIHALQGQSGKLGVSFTARLAAPVVAGFIGYGIGSTFDEPGSGLGSGARGSFIAGGTVAALASVFDIAFLGRARLRQWEIEESTATIHLAPSITDRQAGVVVLGTF